MPLSASSVKKELRAKADPKKAAFVARYFKTGKGEYGEGDIFWGLTVPDQRIVAKNFRGLALPEIKKLLLDKVHECRLTALLILCDNYSRASKQSDGVMMKAIFDFYMEMAELGRINNWDLVDSSARDIVGAYLYENRRAEGISFLEKLAETLAGRISAAKNEADHVRALWLRRIAIIATHYHIGKGEFEPTLRIAAVLLRDSHDLIHKACGWMLREMGKKNAAGLAALHNFLKKYSKTMPRTMLRYAIERLPLAERQHYMKK